MTSIELTLLAIFGLMIGSFLNVCISRLPAGQSVVSGGYGYSTNQGIDTPQPQIVGERAVGNAWVVEMNNVHGLLSVDLDVWAYCIPA